MKILFDHQIYSIQHYGGISRYFTELVNGINKWTPHQSELMVALSDNQYLPNSHSLPGGSFKGRGTITYQLNNLYNAYKLTTNQFDLLHTTYYDPYLLNYLKGKPFVMTLHDMTHERLHEQFSELRPDRFYWGKHEMARRANHIIVVSESTKQDVIELLDIDPNRISVVWHATTMNGSAAITSRQASQISEPYLLYIGNRQGYKNFDQLLRALIDYLPTEKIRLVCAGGGGFTEVEKEQLSALGLGEWVVQQSFKTDLDLANLYSQAEAFVFPSLYEGFGIPILEAFANQCPCILSQTSSFPEVASDAASY
jgi:glycosyltransferase involved in cell wall biosynthesis